MSEVKNVTITVPVGLNGWQQTGSVVINGMKVEFPMGVETQVPETAAALLEKLIEEAKGNAAEGSVGKYKQYVTDADGNAAWEDRLAYKTTAEVVNLAPTELTAGDDGGDGTNESFFLLSPWAVELVAGSVVTVTYNGTVYECAAVDYSQFESAAPAGAVALGNMNALSAIDIEGSNPDAPFVLMALPNAGAADMGGRCGQFMPLDGAASVTIAVSSVVATYKTIDPEYLPKQNQADNTVILTIDEKTGLQPSHSHDEAWALAQAGKHLILHVITSDGGYSLPMTEYKVNGDQRDIYFTVIDSERTLNRWTYGVDGFRMHSEKL